AERAPQAPDRLPGDRQAVKLAQLLGEVGVIEAGIAVLQQRLHLGTHSGGQPPVGWAPPPLVAHRQGAPLAEALLEALKLPGRHVQRRGALPIGDPAGDGRGQQPRPGQLLSAHRESLHRGTTFSRSSYPTTFLCSSSRLPDRPLTPQIPKTKLAAP